MKRRRQVEGAWRGREACSGCRPRPSRLAWFTAGRELLHECQTTDLWCREANLRLQLHSGEPGRQGNGGIAVRAYGFSQNAGEKCPEADCRVNRRQLETVLLNFVHEDASPVPTPEPPFDVSGKGLLSENNRRDRTSLELLSSAIFEFPTGLAGEMKGLVLT